MSSLETSFRSSIGPEQCRLQVASRIGKLTEWARSHKEGITRAISATRGYEIIVEHAKKGNTIDLVLDNGKGKKRSLSDYFPGNQFFYAVEYPIEMEADKRKKVGINPKELPYKGSILSVGHEIGHVRHASEKRSHAQYLPGLNPLERVKLEAYMLKKRFEFSGQLSMGDVSALDVSLTDHFPEWYLRRYFPYQITCERDAWGYAFSMGWDLEKDGFSVMSEFETPQQLWEYMFFHLVTYEIYRLKKLPPELILHPTTPSFIRLNELERIGIKYT